MRRRRWSDSKRRPSTDAGDRVMSASPEKTARIRELNDRLRRHGLGGRIMITRGIAVLGADTVRQILLAVVQFDGFTEDNDPWGEHDCAILTVAGHRIIFKIDYFDHDL